MRHRWSSLGYAGERDLFACRALLHLLATSPQAAASGRALYAVLLSRGLLLPHSHPSSSPLEHFLALTMDLFRLVSNRRA